MPRTTYRTFWIASAGGYLAGERSWVNPILRRDPLVAEALAGGAAA